MLIRFRVENFRSIREEQELSMVASPLSEHPEWVVHMERYRVDLLQAAAIYGPNASGKSTVIAALKFMKSAVEDSYREWDPTGGVPRVPFALDPTTLEAPSLFLVEMLVNGIRYEYGFVVDSHQVLEEWLFAFPKGRKQEWFTRDVARKSHFSFSRHFLGENRAISALTRPNSLFLSVAAQNNHPSITPVYSWFADLFIVDRGSRERLDLLTNQLCHNEQLRAQVLKILVAADLGITGIEPIEEDLRSFISRLELPSDHPSLSRLPKQIVSGVRLRHSTSSREYEVALPFEEESEGTRVLYAFAGLAAAAIVRGSVWVVDELDRSLHPHLALAIVRLFCDPQANPNNAQLIFNTHDTNLLDTSILRRDQIWFTEKGNDGATKLFPLTDFRARKSENIERGYLQGRYGAVPAVRTPDLHKIVEG